MNRGVFFRRLPFGQRSGWKRGFEEFIDNVTKAGEYPIAGKDPLPSLIIIE